MEFLSVGQYLSLWPAIKTLSPDRGKFIFLTDRLAAPEVSDRALLNQCYHPPIGGREDDLDI